MPSALPALSLKADQYSSCCREMGKSISPIKILLFLGPKPRMLPACSCPSLRGAGPPCPSMGHRIVMSVLSFPEHVVVFNTLIQNYRGFVWTSAPRVASGPPPA